ncbi:MAG: carboxypeptidase regulatory-like domain-containing protein [Planctomycetota bacterium]
MLGSRTSPAGGPSRPAGIDAGGAGVLALLLVVLAAIAALALWAFSGGVGPGRPGPAPPAGVSPAADLDAALDPAAAAPAAAVPAAAGDAGPGASPPARQRVAAETVLHGAFAPPSGAWPGGGEAELHAAPEMPEGGFFGALGGAMGRTKGSMQTSQREVLTAIFGRSDPVTSVAVDATGAFRFEEPPPGRYRLVLRHPQLAASERTAFEVAEGDDVDVGILGTQLAGSLVVLVADPEGQPVAGAEVELGHKLDMAQFADPKVMSDMETLFKDMAPREMQTDERGVARFHGLDREAWTLSIEAAHLVDHLRDVRVEVGRETWVQVELGRGADLAVRVLDDEGQPRDDARLRIRWPGAADPALLGSTIQARDAEGRTAWTGEDGLARLRGLRPGTAEVRVVTPGFLEESREVVLVVGEERAIEFRLGMGQTVAGRILDEDDAPIPTARVLRLKILGQQVMGMDVGGFVGVDLLGSRVAARGVPVEPDGTFVLGGFEPGEEVHLVAAAGGYDAVRAPTLVAGATGVELRLLRATTLRGRVVAEPDGAPVAEFEARLEKKVWLVVDRPVAGEAFTGAADGVFELTGAPREQLQLVVRAPGRAEWRKGVDLRKGSVDVGEIRLSLPTSIAGTVVDPDGLPVPDVAVRVSQGGLADSPLMGKMLGQRSVATAADGTFRLEQVSGRRVRLLADKEGFAPLRSKTITLEEGGTVDDVVLHMSRGGSLMGTIVDHQGSPMTSWNVQVSLASGRSLNVARTDAAGVFKVAGMASGTHKIEAFPTDYLDHVAGPTGMRQDFATGEINLGELIQDAMAWSVREQVVIRDGEETEIELVFEAPEGANEGLVTVSGEVRVGTALLRQGMVAWMESGSTVPSRMVPVENGRFRAERVRPGSYRVQVQARLFASAIGRPQVVHVPAADTHHVALDLPGARLSGRVVYADDGSAAGGVLLGLSRPGEGGQADYAADRVDFAEAGALTGSDGKFTFDGLEPGVYDVFAKELLLTGGTGRSGRLGSVNLGAGEVRADLELRMQSAGSVRLLVRDRSTAGARSNAIVTVLAADGTPVELFQRVLTEADGVAVVHGLPPGQYRMLADAPRAAPTSTPPFELGVGERRELTVTLSSGVDVVLKLDGEVPDSLRGVGVAYSVWAPSGSLVRAGRVSMPRDVARDAELRLGTYAPGRYKARLASPIGSLQGEYDVPAGETAVWTVDVDALQ